MSKNKIELTPEIDVDEVLVQIQKKYKNEQINTVDGVKIDFENQWVHLRKSNTEPIIRIYSESDSVATADYLAQKIIQDIKEIISVKSLMRIYLDNAATTPVDKEVKEVMMPFLSDTFGNPSSIHRFGREAKAAVERARRTVSDLLNTSPSELFFTSCGTEADNTALISTIETYGIKTLITSAIEHHAVLHTAHYLEKYRGIKVIYTKHLRDGQIDLADLEEKIKANPKVIGVDHAWQQ